MSRIGYLARDYWFELLIAFLAIAGMLELVVGRDSPGAPSTTLWFAIPAVAVLVLPLFARRRFPFAAPAAYWVLAAALTFVDGLLVPFMGSLGVVGLATAFLLGNLRNRLKAGSVWSSFSPASRSSSTTSPATAVSDWSSFPSLRGRLARRLRPARACRAGRGGGVRAAQAEREREAAARIAVAEERARIARELHDIVAHAVSVMVLQVGAVRHRLPDKLAEDRDALRGVEQAGRTALAEMRRLLGRDAPRRGRLDSCPSPASTASTRWWTRSAAPDFPSSCTSTASRFPLPRAIDLSAYRIVQEGLTNALKHARASHADVTVRYRPDELRSKSATTASGGTTSDGLGHGLVGIRERVKIYGGEMTAGSRARGRLRPQRTPPARGVRAMSIRVLVADDQSMVRAGFRMLLAREHDIEVVAEASNGLEAVDKAAHFRPTVVLMDIRMPELDGLEATRRILAADETARGS